MNLIHKDLDIDRWSKLSVIDQMTNIGSEVLRALQWKSKNNQVYADLANTRALELFDLSLAGTKNISELKEISRARELWLDFYLGDNQYHQTETQWQKYFLAFNAASGLKK